MKLMMYGMPIMFFFVLYDVPSGLLLYWIASNVLTIAQQVVINDMLKKRKLHLATEPAQAARSSAPMKNAGRTTVKSQPASAKPSAQETMGEKVTKWLEQKVGDAGKSDGAAPGSSGKTGKQGGKKR